MNDDFVVVAVAVVVAAAVVEQPQLQPLVTSVVVVVVCRYCSAGIVTETFAASARPRSFAHGPMTQAFYAVTWLAVVVE